MVSARSSSSASTASAKWIPCLRTFAWALPGSYSQSIAGLYVHSYTASTARSARGGRRSADPNGGRVLRSAGFGLREEPQTQAAGLHCRVVNACFLNKHFSSCVGPPPGAAFRLWTLDFFSSPRYQFACTRVKISARCARREILSARLRPWLRHRWQRSFASWEGEH